MLTRSTALGSDACIEMHREGGETVYVLNSAPHRHEPGQTCLAKEWAPPATLMQAIG